MKDYNVDEWIRLFEKEHRTLVWIAEYTGVCDRTISKYLRKKGINTRKNQYQKNYNKFVDEWIKLYEEGYSTIQIADKYRLNQHLVYEYLREAGINFRGAQPFQRFSMYLEEWIELKKKGVSLKDIAATYNTTRQSVASYCKR
ncbi:hypothetical protein [Bacillus sp. N1-1]|uniref:hypothetical protein n=1 Tax=Bacillus sp. N1-1 TaxID=2682541 RepID=UPI0013190EFE|nr:hypothetical protein [Bacillus sp. N1-1]QHA92251.1 hypothetical protein GNK04_12890 [Bacillus sp. N1-1]